MKDCEHIIHEILGMHHIIMNHKDHEIEELAAENSDLRVKILENAIVPSSPILVYSLEEITVCVTLCRESPGKKIQVIKLIRERFGRTLIEAKKLVDTIMYPEQYIHEG